MLTRADAARKPLHGFGWAGWLLLVPLFALVVVVVTGYDLRYRMQELILEWWGLDALYDFTIYGIVHTGMLSGTWPPEPRFGPLTLLIVLLALQLHPRRVGRVRLGMVWILGLLGPALVFWMLARPMKTWLPGEGAWEIAGIGWLFASATILWLATTSWRVGLALAAILAVPVALDWAVFLARTGDLPLSVGSAAHRLTPHLGLPWHLALGAILIPWAIHARVHVVSDAGCERCGYDLTGLVCIVCPECGNTVRSVVDSPPPADPAATPAPSPRSPA